MTHAFDVALAQALELSEEEQHALMTHLANELEIDVTEPELELRRTDRLPTKALKGYRYATGPNGS